MNLLLVKLELMLKKLLMLLLVGLELMKLMKLELMKLRVSCQPVFKAADLSR